MTPIPGVSDYRAIQANSPLAGGTNGDKFSGPAAEGRGTAESVTGAVAGGVVSVSGVQNAASVRGGNLNIVA